MTLRVKDVDFDRREILVRAGKGGKDRRVPLAECSVTPLERQLETARERYDADRHLNVGTTGIPDSLVRKYLAVKRDWRCRPGRTFGRCRSYWGIRICGRR